MQRHSNQHREPRGTHWPRVRLAEVAEINPRQFTVPPGDADRVSFVPMRAVEVESGRMDAGETVTWGSVRKGYTPFQDGDVICAKITPCMENGKFAVAQGLHGGRAAGSTEFHVFRPSPRLHARYLLHFLFRHDVREAARRNMRGAAGQLRVPRLFFDLLEIPLPPLAEQERIVAEIENQLTRLDKGVEALRRVEANLKRYRAAVLKAACEGKLVPTEHELAAAREEVRRQKEEVGSRKDEGRRQTDEGEPSAAGRRARPPNAAVASTSSPPPTSSFFLHPSSLASPPSSFSYESGAQLLQRLLAERRRRWEDEQRRKAAARSKSKTLPSSFVLPPYHPPAAPDTAHLPPLPPGWTWASLAELSFESGYGTSAKCAYDYSGPPVLRIPNVDAGRIDLEDLKFANATEAIPEGDELLPGDLLIIRTNGSRSLIGRAALVTDMLANRTSYASYLIRFRLTAAQPVATWTALVWDVPFLRAWIEQRAATSAGQHNISMTVLSQMPIPLPPLAEQARIIAEVERRLSVVDELSALVAAILLRSTRLRQAILQRAFAGQPQSGSASTPAPSRHSRGL